MKLRPTGYYVLVRMEEVKNEVLDGALAGFQLASGGDHKKEQKGHDVVRVLEFGPTSFVGFRGIDDDANLDARCEQYGVKVGDLVQLNRYDVTEVRHMGEDIFLIQDEHIRGAYYE